MKLAYADSKMVYIVTQNQMKNEEFYCHEKYIFPEVWKIELFFYQKIHNFYPILTFYAVLESA